MIDYSWIIRTIRRLFADLCFTILVSSLPKFPTTSEQLLLNFITFIKTIVIYVVADRNYTENDKERIRSRFTSRMFCEISSLALRMINNFLLGYVRGRMGEVLYERYKTRENASVFGAFPAPRLPHFSLLTPQNRQLHRLYSICNGLYAEG